MKYLRDFVYLLCLLSLLVLSTPTVAAPEPQNRVLRFRLSEEAVDPQRSEPLPRVRSRPLTTDRIEALLAPLPALREDTGAKINLPSQPIPPSRTRTVASPFSAPETIDTATVSAKPLEIVRFSPEGDVPLAPYLSMTFSQPMVALASQSELIVIPVHITPQPPGEWRWVGTQTLVFQPRGRLPMATAYTVTVPAGVRSAIGQELNTARSWSFRTPPPTVKEFYPTTGSQPLSPVLFVAYDQLVDPTAVLARTEVRADEKPWPVRLATIKEVRADVQVRQLSKAARQGYWLALRPLRPFPIDAGITVSIAGGTISREGPRPAIPRQFGFRTHGPQELVQAGCNNGAPVCPPSASWQVVLSNPLEAVAFTPSQVRVEPTVPGLRVSMYSNQLTIEGPFRSKTTYRVTVSGLRDQFGQTLKHPRTLSIRTDAARPDLYATGDSLVALDPAGPRRFSVYSQGHRGLKVRLLAVQPQDWPEFVRYREAFEQGSRKDLAPPGRLVVSRTVPLGTRTEELTQLSIDLTPALENGLGHVLVMVDPVSGSKWERRVATWVQATRLGLDAIADSKKLVGWVSALADGRPLEGVQLSLSIDHLQTDARGMAEFAPVRGSLLIARRGADTAFLPDSDWTGPSAEKTLRWYVVDDRKLYRPGEEVHLKGWVRQADSEGPAPTSARQVTYKVYDSQNNQLSQGTRTLNALGGFDLAFTIPERANLGSATVTFEAEGTTETEQTFGHSFRIEEFRRPEYEVQVSADADAYIVGKSAQLTAAASYYTGGGLPEAEVDWYVSASPASFTPPNRADFTFGTWTPWWRPAFAGNGDSKSFKSRTDSTGMHRLRVDFESVDPPRTTRLSASASVNDVNRQSWNGTTGFLVHPANLYVGLRSERTFVEPGENLQVKSIVTDLEGKAIPGRAVTLRATRLESVFTRGEWREQDRDPQICTVQSELEPVACRFKSQKGGEYRVRATIRDTEGRLNASELRLWVAGGAYQRASSADQEVDQEEVQLIPDRKEYQPGETARILVQSPFFPTEGLVTLQGAGGIIRSERFRMDGSSYTLQVPIEERYLPNVHVQVDLVGAAPRTDATGREDKRLPRRPAFASGQLKLLIPPLVRKLTVEATPRTPLLAPGEQTVIDVQVRDRAGNPIQDSELVVIVVDESVLALADYQLPDPLAAFYPQQEARTSSSHLRQEIVLASSEEIQSRSINSGLGRASGEEVVVTGVPRAIASRTIPQALKLVPGINVMDSQGGIIKGLLLRSNFNPLAIFAPSVTTDARGQVQVPVKLPDNLTRYRVMAVAVAGATRFGTGESTLTARLPLTVRPSAPRFLNFGDRFELPVVLQNQTNRPLNVEVALRAGGVTLLREAGQQVTVAADDRVEVRFSAEAQQAGTAHFQLRALSGALTDATEFTLPVQTPATTEASATYGVIDEGAVVQPIQPPADVLPEVGGLEVTTSSTQLQSLTDAVLYLTHYPYEGTEQISSRLLATAALRDVQAAFQTEGLPSPAELDLLAEQDVQRLTKLQNYDGGFAFWKQGDVSWPYLGIHAAHALQRAQEKGFTVPSQVLAKSGEYLRTIEAHIQSHYPGEERQALIAYALYVRHRMGDGDPKRARKLIQEAGAQIPLEAVGWLLPVLSNPGSSAEVAAIRRLLDNRVTETAGSAHFTTSYSDGQYLLLHSEYRTDAVLLEALIEDRPQSDLIPKLARGLLAHRTKGCWNSTQENAFALLALGRYFAVYEQTTPDFVARAWLGERYAGDHTFKGRTNDQQQITVPMQVLATKGLQDLTLLKEGKGRLYYRVGMKYAPASLKLDAFERGFTVERTYEAMDEPRDVRRDDTGTWHIRSGKRVRVRLIMVAPARRTHVALVDPLPPGLEVLNPSLAVTALAPAPPDPIRDESWLTAWFEHQNLRDKQVEAFASLLPAGLYSYSYVARATTPGEYLVPPTKAEEMYEPEVFGRSSTDHVIVE